MSAKAIDAIIDDLKQGNAIEMELVNKFKGGLGVVANGMRDECLDRSEALDDLRENLHKKILTENAKPTAAMKSWFKAHIDSTILDYQNCIKWIDTECAHEIDAAVADFQPEKKAHDEALVREREQERQMDDIAGLMKNMLIMAGPTLRMYDPLETLESEFYKMKSMWVTDRRISADSRERNRYRFGFRVHMAFENCEREKGWCMLQIDAYKEMAMKLNIKLEGV